MIFVHVCFVSQDKCSGEYRHDKVTERSEREIYKVPNVTGEVQHVRGGRHQR